jgi:hypothetical protein
MKAARSLATNEGEKGTRQAFCRSAAAPATVSGVPTHLRHWASSPGKAVPAIRREPGDLPCAGQSAWAAGGAAGEAQCQKFRVQFWAVGVAGSPSPAPGLGPGGWREAPDGVWARCFDVERAARPSPRTYNEPSLLSAPHPAFGHLPRFAEKGSPLTARNSMTSIAYSDEGSGAGRRRDERRLRR